MNWLPRDTVLGELTLLETYVFYDGPRLFTARSLTDQRYLVAWASEGPEADEWLYVAISEARLKMVRSGARTVRSAFLDPEGFTYRVTIPHDDSVPDSVTTVVPSEISEAWLPGENFRIDEPTVTTRLADTAAEVELKARQENRTRLRLRLAYANRRRTEAPTRQVGNLLVDAQKLLDNVGFSLESEKVASRGVIPKGTRQRTSSEVVELTAASFMIELGASSFDDLYGGSLFADSANAIINLMDPVKRSPELGPELAALGPRATKSFRNFVEKLADTGADITIAAAGSGFSYHGYELSSGRVEELYRILAHEIAADDIDEIRGRMELYAYNSERQTFGLRQGDVHYEGRVDQRVSQVYRNPTINERYDVLIYATSTQEEMTKEVRVVYALMQMMPVSPEDDDDGAEEFDEDD
jgi:hypothetical protein